MISFASIAMLFTSPMARAAEIERPEQGDVSLSFGLPGGGNGTVAGAAGVWFMVADRVNLGLNLGLAIDGDGDDALDLVLAPVARFYLDDGRGRIAPFALGEVQLGVFDTGADANVDLSAAGGFGGEVWLIDELSLAGHVGVRLDILRGGGGSPAIATFTSGLTANFYFGSNSDR